MHMSENDSQDTVNQQPNVVIKTCHLLWTNWNHLGLKSQLLFCCYVLVYLTSVFLSIALYSETKRDLAGVGCGLQLLAYFSLLVSWTCKNKLYKCYQAGQCINLLLDWMQQYFAGMLPFIFHFVGSALVSVVGFNYGEHHELGIIASMFSWVSFVITCSMSCMTLCKPPPDTDVFSIPNWV